MKIWIFCLAPTLAICADQTQLQRLFDGKVTSSQRATVCFDLRGNPDAEVVRALGKALEDPALLSCAAENLRIVGGIEILKQALSNQDAQVRAAAVRQLGTFQRPDLIDTISQAAQDENLLVATNALAALSEYQDPVVLPALASLAKNGGMVGDMALDRMSQLQPATALVIARELLHSSQIPDRLYAMRVISAYGDASDLGELNKIAKSSPENLSQRARGFGFMPAINIARAAQSAIASIQSRQP